MVAGKRLSGGQGVIVQVSVRQTEYTSNGMSYRYKTMLHFVHDSYNSRIAIFSVPSINMRFH